MWLVMYVNFSMYNKQVKLRMSPCSGAAKRLENNQGLSTLWKMGQITNINDMG